MITPFIRRNAIAALTLLGLVFGLPGQGMAGGGAFCSNPFIFQGSDVNVVVIPYSLRGPDEEYRQRARYGDLFESRVAQKLSILIQQDTLFALSYPAGMGVVHIIPDSNDCTAENVLRRVEPQLLDGKGLVLLWGHFLEDENQIYVQSYARFLRKDRSESIRFLPEGAPELDLTGGPSQRAIGFAPRLLDEEDLAAVEKAFEEGSKIYADRRGDTVVGTLEFSLDRPIAYYVDDIDLDSGRMHVRPHEYLGGPEGWVAARADPTIWPLGQKLPELTFVNAVAGYLAARIIEDERRDSHWAGPWDRRLRTTVARSQAGFARYLSAVEEDRDKRDSFDERAAVALSYSLSGMLDLLAGRVADGDGTIALADAAVRKFEAARHFAPYQAETRNLLAMSLAGTALRDRDARARAVKTWSTALSLDPASDRIAGNLAQFYGYLIRTDPEGSGLSERELRARWASLAEAERRSRTRE
ncbi:MAG: hypothetical protein CMM50_17065 [Rhodospirillaceae bacterium]|nr:hypothetical protein [Rhodospirillaceae bacterium]